MTALRGTDIEMVSLAEAVESLKTVPDARYAEAECVLSRSIQYSVRG
ncbi:hypothetical protein STENM327S_04765 [Streptomyces tendae]